MEILCDADGLTAKEKAIYSWSVKFDKNSKVCLVKIANAIINYLHLLNESKIASQPFRL